MKVLLASRFPPDRDGIASYAVQLAATLRRGGHQVEVVSPQPSAAQFHADFHTTRGLLRLLYLSRRADRTVVQFVAGHYFKSLHPYDFLLHWPAFAAMLAFGRRVELVVHEAPYNDLLRASPPRGWVVRTLWRAIFTLPKATYVHTKWEQEQLARSVDIDPSRISLLDHGRDFLKRTQLDRREARRELGLKSDAHIFLCIGFVQSHKGFDRAVRALRRLNGSTVRLEIVGSMRVPAPEIEAYVHELRMLVAGTPRATLHESYLNDELFDRWIVAADTVVLPYRDIWSSGVVERAKLYGRSLIVSSVGGLPEQAGPLAKVVRNDDELCEAMAEAAQVGFAVTDPAFEPRPTDRAGVPTAMVAEVVRTRAAALRNRSENGAPPPPLTYIDTVRTMPPLRLPAAESGFSARSFIKNFVSRLTRWELRPIVNRVNDLDHRTDVRLTQIERELSEIRDILSRLEGVTVRGNGQASAAVELPSSPPIGPQSSRGVRSGQSNGRNKHLGVLAEPEPDPVAEITVGVAESAKAD